ncbi:hypothetical protein CC85DRAFT_80854 [Cutaneotrichosporon oleaginosum]|uniref:Uncharacterized protein n=1 Tax=Cutaneotrichosporon oleaginosum TaxID=879819 RepID=A0A0J0XNI0_9TREE|nr:uncharacterized protein CC85DRAFT_80854 [Cutaneotrichosporon oleaginosum]KLT42637.1 hypothetical protein CC85DRAFT_80854 [Cutaneotrichosporon oleaginosum]TXT05246.1 hypothetical protein COLE_06566 [Cutaneotrichosporon oleaginosum]
MPPTSRPLLRPSRSCACTCPWRLAHPKPPTAKPPTTRLCPTLRAPVLRPAILLAHEITNLPPTHALPCTPKGQGPRASSLKSAAEACANSSSQHTRFLAPSLRPASHSQAGMPSFPPKPPSRACRRLLVQDEGMVPRGLEPSFFTSPPELHIFHMQALALAGRWGSPKRSELTPHPHTKP